MATCVRITLRWLASLAVLALLFASPVAEAVPLVIVVNSTADPGDGVCNAAQCTLREAIDATNAASDPDIHFAIPDSDPGRNPDGTFTIFTNGLPDVTTPANIDATTQPGYDGTPLIELNGSLVGGLAGFDLAAGNSSVRGFSITFFMVGIALNSGNNTVAGNHIGVDPSGTSDQGNGLGIFLGPGGNNTIGGESADDRNVISGNDVHGIYQGSNMSTVSIWGNYIGTDVTGMNAIPNSEDGIRVNSALIGPHEFDGNFIGRPNVIASNLGAGVNVQNGMFVRVSGNLIGTDRTGNHAMHNELGGVILQDTFRSWIGIEHGPAAEGNVIADWIEVNGNSNENSIKGNRIGISPNGSALGGYGVYIDGGTQNVVGGTDPGDGNIIALNGDVGVTVRDIQSPSTGNSILGNSIYGNHHPGGPPRWGIGIDLRHYDPVNNPATEPTPNDPQDADTGPNGLQNFPELTSALSGSITVAGTLNSTPGHDFRVEFFDNEECDATGYGEGQTYIGFTEVHTEGDGNGDFIFKAEDAVPPGHSITSTATDLSSGDTSEFSQCVEVEPAPTPTPAPTESPAPTASPTPTPTATPGATLTQGDVQCDGDVDAVDALQQLRDVAALEVFQQDGCPQIGAAGLPAGEAGGIFGDVDCDGDVDSVDALKVLRHVAALGVAQTEPCPDIGEPL